MLKIAKACVSGGPGRHEGEPGSPCGLFRAHRTRRAFTLIEVVLVLGLMSILVAVLVVGTGTGIESEYLDQGAAQFETMLRMARAEAANEGRKLRLMIEEEEHNVSIQWEPQPLAEPGEFVEYTDGSWARSLPNHMVRVLRCQRTGDSSYSTLTFGESMSDDELSLDALEFFPDGSSDSALIILASQDMDDLRRAVIELDGGNGIVTTSVMTSIELEEYFEENEIEAVGEELEL